MSKSLAYFRDLLSQDYPEAQATKWTQKHYPEFQPPETVEKIESGEPANILDGPIVQQVTMISSHNVIFGERNPILDKVAIGMIAFAMLLLLFGIFMKSWHIPETDEIGMSGGMGLNSAYLDCSEVTGIDPDTGYSNKLMCKGGIALFAEEISIGELIAASDSDDSIMALYAAQDETQTVSISDMCEVGKDLNLENLDKCEDKASAGLTASVFLWIGFVIALMTISLMIIGELEIASPNQRITAYYGLGSGGCMLIGIILWILMYPVSKVSDINFGFGFYITLIASFITLGSAALVLSNEGKSTTFIPTYSSEDE